VGVRYTSAIRVENKTPIVESKDDCGCNEVSDVDIVKLDKQLDRLERYNNELFVLIKDNPEINPNNENLLKNIKSAKLWNFPIFCKSLLESFKHLRDLSFYFINMIHKGIIYVILFGITLTIGVLTNWIMVKLGCENLPYI
jgi:hypothetical protein